MKFSSGVVYGLYGVINPALLFREVCIIVQECASTPCDGSVFPECQAAGPDPLPGVCNCSNCSWDASDSGRSEAVPLCPAGFVCGDPNLPPMPTYIGPSCTCQSSDCQQDL